MRKVTKKTVQAFIDGTTTTSGNTVSTGNTLLLHNNEIARRLPDGSIVATLAGWPTPTTRERLNGLCELLGLGRPFCQKQNEQYFRDKPIASDETVTLLAA